MTTLPPGSTIAIRLDGRWRAAKVLARSYAGITAVTCAEPAMLVRVPAKAMGRDVRDVRVVGA